MRNLSRLFLAPTLAATVPLLKIRSALIGINTADARLPPHAAVAAARTANLHF